MLLKSRLEGKIVSTQSFDHPITQLSLSGRAAYNKSAIVEAQNLAPLPMHFCYIRQAFGS